MLSEDYQSLRNITQNITLKPKPYLKARYMFETSVVRIREGEGEREEGEVLNKSHLEIALLLLPLHDLSLSRNHNSAFMVKGT